MQGVSCFMEDYLSHVKASRDIILSLATELCLSVKLYSLKKVKKKRNYLKGNNRIVRFQVSLATSVANEHSASFMKFTTDAHLTLNLIRAVKICKQPLMRFVMESEVHTNFVHNIISPHAIRI